MSFYFSINDWMLGLKLSKSELLIYAYIKSFENSKLDYLTDKAICYRLNISFSNFRKSIKNLIDKKYIVKVKSDVLKITFYKTYRNPKKMEFDIWYDNEF